MKQRTEFVPLQKEDVGSKRRSRKKTRHENWRMICKRITYSSTMTDNGDKITRELGVLRMFIFSSFHSCWYDTMYFSFFIVIVQCLLKVILRNSISMYIIVIFMRSR
jgi:hypothetical protein